jgi:hypothetical protein
MKSPLRTHKGSKIDRGYVHPGIGEISKRMGNRVYVHKNYANALFDQETIQQLNFKATMEDFRYNCIMLDKALSTVRLDEAPNFDHAREPRVGKYIILKPHSPMALWSPTLSPEFYVIHKSSSSHIWHHKWLWVADGYAFFDVDASYEWSKEWLSKLKETAKGTLAAWEEQLFQYGLPFDQASHT